MKFHCALESIVTSTKKVAKYDSAARNEHPNVQKKKKKHASNFLSAFK